MKIRRLKSRSSTGWCRQNQKPHFVPFRAFYTDAKTHAASILIGFVLSHQRRPREAGRGRAERLSCSDRPLWRPCALVCPMSRLLLVSLIYLRCIHHFLFGSNLSLEIVVFEAAGSRSVLHAISFEAAGGRFVLHATQTNSKTNPRLW